MKLPVATETSGSIPPNWKLGGREMRRSAPSRGIFTRPGPIADIGPSPMGNALCFDMSDGSTDLGRPFLTDNRVERRLAAILAADDCSGWFALHFCVVQRQWERRTD